MFDDRLKELREKKGMTLQQIADELGIPKTTYNNYELDKREPSAMMLLKIATYFNVTPDYLLGFKPSNDKKSPPRTRREELQETLTPLLETLDVSQLTDLIKYVEYLIWLEEKEQS